MRLLELYTKYYVGIVLNHCQYGVLYYSTGPYINFPIFGNLEKLPCDYCGSGSASSGVLKNRLGLGNVASARLCPGIYPACSMSARCLISDWEFLTALHTGYSACNSHPCFWRCKLRSGRCLIGLCFRGSEVLTCHSR